MEDSKLFQRKGGVLRHRRDATLPCCATCGAPVGDDGKYNVPKASPATSTKADSRGLLQQFSDQQRAPKPKRGGR